MPAIPSRADAPAAPAPSRLVALLADPRRVLLVAAALAMFAACVDVLHDPDLFWHLRLGQWILDHHVVPHHELFSFTAQGNPMVAHEWGSEVLFSLINRAGGLLLVAVVMGLVAWSGLVALGLRARARGAGLVAIAVALLLGARTMEPVLGTRPQVITVALVCWTLLIAERHLAGASRRLIWLLPPVALVWANLHGAVVLGLAALGAVVVLEAVRRLAPWRRLGSLALATGVAAGVGCLNPNGPGLYRYVVETSGSERAKPIAEWHAPNFGDPSNLGLLILMVSFALLIALGGRLSLRDLVMSAGGFAAALLAVRNTSLAVALALPAWAAMLQQVIDRFNARRKVTRRSTVARRAARSPAVAAGAMIVALALAVDGIVVARAAQDASPSGVATTYPACAASALAGVDGVRIVAPYFHSGYLIDRLWPQGRVFLYGESVSLGARVFDDYLRIFGGGPRALDLLSAYGANAVLVGPGGLYDTLRASSDWRATVHDPLGATLFLTPLLAARLPQNGSC